MQALTLQARDYPELTHGCRETPDGTDPQDPTFITFTPTEVQFGPMVSHPYDREWAEQVIAAWEGADVHDISTNPANTFDSMLCWGWQRRTSSSWVGHEIRDNRSGTNFLIHPEQLPDAIAYLKAVVTGEPTTPYLTNAEEFLAKVMTTIKKKNADYCADATADPLDNLRLSEKLGICDTKTAIMSRMCDKLARARNLVLNSDREAQVSSESIQDTLEDIVGYVLLLDYAVKETA